MKKILFLFMILGLLGLVGCSEDNTDKLDIPKNSNQVVTQQQIDEQTKQQEEEQKQQQEDDDIAIQTAVDMMMMSVATN